MLSRVLPTLAMLAVAACPSFAVGPDAYLLEPEPGDCRSADLPLESCSQFLIDNGTIFFADVSRPLVLRFGFKSTDRNLAFLYVSYERPGHLPEIALFDLRTGMEPVAASSGTGDSTAGTTTSGGSDTGGPLRTETDGETETGGTGDGVDTPGGLESRESLRIDRAVLADSLGDDSLAVTTASQGELEVDLTILADSAGPHAITAWLTDVNEYNSQQVQWQFTVLDSMPDREPEPESP